MSVAGGTELPRNGWQSVPADGCKSGAIEKFSGRVFLLLTVGTELSRICWQSVLIRGGAGRSHRFLAERFVSVAVKMTLPTIFLQSVSVGRSKDGATENFVAERCCWWQ